MWGTTMSDLEVKFLSQSFEFIPELGVSGFVRQDLVTSYQPMEGERAREYSYLRHSWAETVDADEFEFLRAFPFGLATVSGA